MMKNVFKYPIIVVATIFVSSCQTAQQRNELTLTTIHKSWDVKLQKKSANYGRTQSLIANTSDGFRSEVYYYEGNGGVYGSPIFISKQQIQKWNIFKNRNFTLERSQKYKNHIGNIEFAKIVLQNRDCYYFISAISISTSDSMNRPDKVLIGYYCGPLNNKLDGNEIYSFLDSLSLSTPDRKKSTPKDNYGEKTVDPNRGPATSLRAASQPNSGVSSKRKTTEKLGSRPIAISWDNKFGLMAGSIEFTDKQNKGRLYFDLPNASGQCLGQFSRTDNQGVWSASCPKGISASGNFSVTNKGGSGAGTDNEGNEVRFSLGALSH